MSFSRLQTSGDDRFLLLSNEGIDLLCDNRSFVDERLILAFRKQKHNSTCGVASFCVVMTALNLHNYESCNSNLSVITNDNDGLKLTKAKADKVYTSRPKISKECPRILKNLQKTLLDFVATGGNKEPLSFLDSFKNGEELLENRSYAINKTVVWPQRCLLDKSEDDDKEKQSENIKLDTKNEIVNHPLWLDEEEVLNSVVMKSTLDSDIISTHGMTLNHLAALVRSYKFKEQITHASETNLEDFRRNAAEIVRDSNDCVIVNYDAKLVDPNQAFSGHHSPLAGYNSNYDLFLLLDVWPQNREQWIKASKLFKAMNTIDNGSVKSRGYLIVHNN